MSMLSCYTARLAARGSLKRALQRRNGVQSSGSMADETIVLVFGGNMVIRQTIVNMVKVSSGD
jgi:hypothetical protein